MKQHQGGEETEPDGRARTEIGHSHQRQRQARQHADLGKYDPLLACTELPDVEVVDERPHQKLPRPRQHDGRREGPESSRIHAAALELESQSHARKTLRQALAQIQSPERRKTTGLGLQ